MCKKLIDIERITDGYKQYFGLWWWCKSARKRGTRCDEYYGTFYEKIKQ